jgi:predicted MPP superfamily phosphohydrolase
MLCFKKKIVKYISPIGLLLGCICAILMWWGALVNRYEVDIEEVVVEINDLPASFDDYKIAQISDLHLGTFNGDTIFVSKLVDIINTLDVDLVTFTGDIVNRKSEELLPYESLLSRIQAKDGVLSVLGNHDYGDYLDWATPKDKEENLRLMYEINQRMGWDLLLNESKYLYRGNDSIVVIGVENIGDPPFKVYGSLGEANQSLADSTIKILLTHNPAHWEQDIKDTKKYNIALTLSGHTHAMQIELFGLSPSIFRYNYWKGLYKDSLNRYLYVNVGAGTVAMPMRIGATPEITVLTLKCAK